MLRVEVSQESPKNRKNREKSAYEFPIKSLCRDSCRGGRGVQLDILGDGGARTQLRADWARADWEHAGFPPAPRRLSYEFLGKNANFPKQNICSLFETTTSLKQRLILSTVSNIFDEFRNQTNRSYPVVVITSTRDEKVENKSDRGDSRE